MTHFKRMLLSLLLMMYFFFTASLVYSQDCNCDLVIEPSTNGRTFTNGQNGVNVPEGGTICIKGGVHNFLVFKNFRTESASSRFTFINCDGQAVIHSTHFGKGIEFDNCKNFRLTGTGDPAYEYGIHVEGVWNSSQGVFYPEWGTKAINLSTDFEMDHLKHSNIDFSAFNIKDDINCNTTANRRGNFVMRNVDLHDNLIEDCRRGEGFYIGYTFYFGNPNLPCPDALPHELENVKVYRNKIYRTGREGIQIGSSPRNIEIFENIIEDYGLDQGQGVGQRNAVQLGLGTSTHFYNNYIKGDATSAGGAIKVFGPHNVIYNNIIVNAVEMGIYTHKNSDDHMEQVEIYNNTFINPVGPAIDIRNEYASNHIKNNLIVRASGTNYISKASGVSSSLIDSSNNYRTNNIGSVHFTDHSAGNYRLSESTPEYIKSGGINLYGEGVTVDYDWQPRPSSGAGFSIGAFQFNDEVIPAISTDQISPSSFCNNQSSSISVAFTITGSFNSGNVFTAELSDTSGSFASPVILGSKSGTTSDVINGILPSGLAAGTGYKIRVRSSSPAVVSTPSSSSVTIQSNCNNTECSATGYIRREMYTGVSGDKVYHLVAHSSFPDNPTSVHSDPIFESPTNWGENYGQKVSGYVCPPVTGNYYFYISGNDNCELYLSSDASPVNKSKIAEVPGFTGVREWNKYPEQKSGAVYLIAGTRYYIEALHKEGVNNDNLAVGWELPDGTLERPIPGSRLALPEATQGPESCSATGSITREFFSDVSGDKVYHLTGHASFPNSPSLVQAINLFEGPTNVADNYGTRIRGFICPPVSGDYYFYISGNDNSELWLSTNNDPVNKSKVAEVTGFTGVREWNKYPSQKSAAITLVAGQMYYIEALHKEGINSDNIAVGWELPDGTLERPIPGSRLAPWTENAFRIGISDNGQIGIAKETALLYPNPAEKTFAIVSDKIHGCYKVQMFSLNDVLEKEVEQCERGAEIDISNLEPGIYFINIIQGDLSIRKKLVITR